MSANENGAVVRRFIDEVFNGGNFSAAEEILAPDYVHHDPATADMGSGREGLEQMVTFYRQAFPDFSVKLDDQIIAEDKVVERWTGRGTHQGALMGIPATGRTITATGISIHRLAGGKIAETWTIFDTAGMLRQLGMVPGQQ
ncbi:MAG: ester cyclase [Gemmatimonadetes bacterium]|nr:ester cyclase [Gemmatimonadota bacterium]